MNDPIRPPFTDEQLRQYLAGDAEPALREALDAALEDDDALGERLHALDAFAIDLKPAFDALLQQAPTEALSARMPPPARALPDRRLTLKGLAGGMAAAVAAFAVGVVAGRGPLAPSGPTTAGAPPAPAPVGPSVGPPVRPAWLEAVAGYVRLFGPETFSGPPDPAVRTRALSALSTAVARNLGRLAELPGLELQRAEALQLKGRPLGQLAYLDAAGAPVAICILHRATPKEGFPPPPPAPQFQVAAIDELNAVFWDVQPHGFLVIGRQSPQTLRAIADEAARRLAS